MMDWIEDMTEEEVDDLFLSLRSGRILCILINKILPGKIAKINKTGVAMRERVRFD